MKRIRFISLATTVMVALFMLSACGGASTLQPAVESAVDTIVEAATALPAAEATAEPAAGHTTAAHWTYEGEDGPKNWAALSAAYAACAGTAQSPIDLTDAGAQDLANLVFNYQTSPITVTNNGHTVLVDYASGSMIELDGHRYKLLQFHFHAPSEHTINGQPAAAELHLVHEIDDGSLPEGSKAVVGVMIQAGAENAALAAVWDQLAVANATPQPVDGEVNAAALLPAVQTTYRYAGSLTTPPCTENVSWNVMTDPIEMSQAQLDAYTALFEGPTNRPVQSLNERELAVDSTP